MAAHQLMSCRRGEVRGEEREGRKGKRDRRGGERRGIGGEGDMPAVN